MEKKKKNHLALKCMNQHLLTTISPPISYQRVLRCHKTSAIKAWRVSTLNSKYTAQSLFLNPYGSQSPSPQPWSLSYNRGRPSGVGHHLGISALNARYPQEHRHKCSRAALHSQLLYFRGPPPQCPFKPPGSTENSWCPGHAWEPANLRTRALFKREGKCVIHLSTLTSKVTFKILKALLSISNCMEKLLLQKNICSQKSNRWSPIIID